MSENDLLEEYINPLGIKLLFNAKTLFCFNGCWSHERTHSIESRRNGAQVIILDACKYLVYVIFSSREGQSSSFIKLEQIIKFVEVYFASH